MDDSSCPSLGLNDSSHPSSVSPLHPIPSTPCPHTFPALKNTFDMPKQKSLSSIPTALKRARLKVRGSSLANLAGRTSLYLRKEGGRRGGEGRGEGRGGEGRGRGGKCGSSEGEREHQKRGSRVVEMAVTVGMCGSYMCANTLTAQKQ